MKNLITDFGIFINENYSFDGISLTEKENEKSGNSLSGLSTATALVCSSTAKTTNATAFKSLTEGFSEEGFKKGGSDRSKVAPELLPLVSTSIKDDKDAPVTTMKEDQALFFKNGRTSVGPKTDKARKNYLKVGDKLLLDGDNGKLVTKDIKFKELKEEGKVVEASGNGIFVLGRLLKTRALGTINDDTKVYLGMNYLKPTVLVANANTGFQGKGPGIEIIIAMMGKKFFIPHKENFKAYAVEGRKLSEDTDEKKESIFSRAAIPSISMPIDDETYLQKNLNPELRKVGDAKTVSADKAFKGFSPKSVSGEPEDYQINELVKIYLSAQKEISQPWFALIGERLKYFYNDIISKDFGVPNFVFADIDKQIDSSIEGLAEQYKKSQDSEWAKAEIKKYFYPKKEGSTTGNRGAKASVEVSKQSQGGI